MTYTLISSVGTGMYNKEGGYRKTNYLYPDGTKIESQIFLDTLLKKKYRDFEKVILVGTLTSSWDVYLDLENHEQEAKWFSIKEECETSGISEENIKYLEKILTERYSIPFVIKVHSPEVSAENVDLIFKTYMEACNDVSKKSDSKILLDITHGFRSMPILLYQAIQLDSVGKNMPPVELVYGEFVPDKRISYVRDLSSYWDYYEITNALALFKNKLNAKPLAEKLNQYWESGSKALIYFSETVECNYSLQLPEVLKQMKNSLERIERKSVPEWVLSVYDEVQDLYKKLSQSSLEKSLFAYAELLEEKGLITQAVIALQVCIETAVTLKAGNENYVGDYDWWQEYGRIQFNEIKNNNYEIRQPLWKIESVRNEIAHGGAREKKTKEYPSSSKLPNILKDGKKAVKRLFEILDED